MLRRRPIGASRGRQTWRPVAGHRKRCLTARQIREVVDSAKRAAGLKRLSEGTACATSRERLCNFGRRLQAASSRAEVWSSSLRGSSPFVVRITQIATRYQARGLACPPRRYGGGAKFSLLSRPFGVLGTSSVPCLVSRVSSPFSNAPCSSTPMAARPCLVMRSERVLFLVAVPDRQCAVCWDFLSGAL